MITRFAPTPSGYLHVGNAVNAQLVAWLAAAHEGAIHLRLDDLDAARSRPEYVEDVFDVLAWLGIAWQSGPRDARDVADRASTDRTGPYREALAIAAGSSLELYACDCSRAMLTGVAAGGCPGGCRTRGLALVPGHTALRVHVRPGTIVPAGSRAVDLAAEVGDFVVWRRDDVPAYHLVSVVDDDALGVTHVVRGADLVPSTAAQLFLAPHVGAPAFADAVLLHHRIITDGAGHKLSKSQVRTGRPLERTAQQRTAIQMAAREIGAGMGIHPPS